MTADSEETSACKALWLAFINQMISDACGVACTDLERQQAYDYLFKPNRHLNEVCALAELEPDFVRAAARKRVGASKHVRRERPVQPKHTKLGRTHTINGVTKRMIDWINESPVSRDTIYKRIRNGWSVEDALFTPARFNGKPGGGVEGTTNGRPDQCSPSS
ncbi:hypothetical protein ACE10X_27170 [Bradyrhizobium sp. Pha-3]|uniref:hypothetical protein n=1 Tax=Bradyrhizobium sp. Pha-3 TaxID=208375 RepID=UPI0035D47425